MDNPTYHLVFQIIIFLVLAFFGTGLTQILKNYLKIQDRLALFLTVVIAALLSILELFLSQVIGIQDFTLEQFPKTFVTIFTLASIYYGWFKGSEGIFGKGGVLKQ